ncbi:hypothetical protein ABZT17_11765 [Streptomyces sp. NPDC005648]|uniref:hypothetical protein n=1 Tax=Streptomyces sp. NPDC005648 TaxID=3157044 RepID=UPI0033B0E6DF
MEQVLATETGNGHGNGLLFGLREADSRTRAVVRFSRLYRRSASLLGPAQTMADRCFTVGLPTTAAKRGQVRVVAHGAGESCTAVAATGLEGRGGAEGARGSRGGVRMSA